MLIRNATLVTLDPPFIRPGQDLRLADGSIAEVADVLLPARGEDVLDVEGRIALPGLVCGHHHLYSSLARGMPGPRRTPASFHEILQFVWWVLDRALDEEGVYISTLVGCMEAALCGTTTIVDHHSSPSFIEGSLGTQARAFREVGLRGILCYEVTDRGGLEARDRGLLENERFIETTREDTQLAGLVGAHASFTLSDASMEMLSDLARRTGRGVHIHVAEDPCDVEDARRRGSTLVERLERFGFVGPQSIFGHGTHLSPDELLRVLCGGVRIAHNCRSNMQNQVGHAPIHLYHASGLLGTDGISGSMLEEAKAAYFKARDGHKGIGAEEILGLLVHNAQFASGCLHVPLGSLEPGSAADLIVLDYLSPTPLTDRNLPWHVIFGIQDRHVRDVFVKGVRIVANRAFTAIDAEAVYARAREYAYKLWARMAGG